VIGIALDSPVARVLEALGDSVRPTGPGKWTARCPAHDDRHASLTVSTGDNGAALIRCHAGAGCSFESIVAALGIEVKDLFPPKAHNGNGHHANNGQRRTTKPPTTHPTWERAVAAGEFVTKGRFAGFWSYRNADGDEYARVVRFNIGDGKEFKPFRSVAGGWQMKDPEQWHPYRLPELLNAREDDPDGIVIITEGEKSADAAASIGLMASTSAHGAKSPGKTDWGSLAGRDVAVMPDADPAGEKYAEQVAGILSRLDPPAHVRIVHIPDLPPKGDFVEFVRAGGTHQKFMELTANAGHEIRLREDRKSKGSQKSAKASDKVDTEKETANVASAGHKPLAFHPVSAGQLVDTYPTERPYLLDGLLRMGETANIVASPKTYKSYLALCIALCVAAGRSLFGMFQATQGRVLVIDNELHGETISNRIVKVATALGISPDIWRGSIDVLSLRGKNADINSLGSLMRSISRGTYALILMDALYRLWPPDCEENSNGGVTRVYNTIDSYAEMTGAAIICIHHSSKGIQGGKAVTDTGSGAGAQSRAPDDHFVIRQHEEEGCAVLDAVLRSSAPMRPIGLRWRYPLWIPDPDLDVTLLKRERGTGGRPRKTDGDKPAKLEPHIWTPQEFVTAFVSTEPNSKDLILARASGSGVGGTTAKNLLMLAIDQKMVYPHHISGDNKAYFATTEQQLPGVSVCVARPPTPPSGRRKKRVATGKRVSARHTDTGGK
jgi:hypothetical protein